MRLDFDKALVAAALLDALTLPTRRSLLNNIIKHGVSTRQEMVDQTGFSRALVYHHLKILVNSGLVEWMEEPYRQSGRPLKPVQVDLKEPKQRLLPIQLKWVDYGPELLDSAQQAVLQLSNRRFDWPISIAGRATRGGLAIVHQSLQQLGGQVTMDLPKGVPGLTLQVLMPLQD